MDLLKELKQFEEMICEKVKFIEGENCIKVDIVGMYKGQIEVEITNHDEVWRKLYDVKDIVGE